VRAFQHTQPLLSDEARLRREGNSPVAWMGCGADNGVAIITAGRTMPNPTPSPLAPRRSTAAARRALILGSSPAGEGMFQALAVCVCGSGRLRPQRRRETQGADVASMRGAGWPLGAERPPILARQQQKT
jgi:hypothetical protein